MTEKYYTQKIEEPKNAQEGMQNFVQMIINQLEDGNTREALLLAVSLRGDIADNCYQITIDEEPVEINLPAHLFNNR